MNEANILAATYHDRCAITRPGSEIKDPITKQTSQTLVVVAQDIPCALSSSTGGSIGFTGGYGSYHSGYTLFTRPEVDIRAGDRLLVTTAAKQSYELWAGRPDVFANSHTETPLSEEKNT